MAKLETRVGGVESRLGEIDTRVQAMDAKLSNVETNMVTKQAFDERANGLEKRMGKMERSLKRRIGEVRTDLARRIVNVATTTPTIQQFNDLKARVDRYHAPAN